MDKYKNFFYSHRGAIIGALIALLILFTGFYRLIIGIILVVICMFLGHYVQKNKYSVKERLKDFIDRI